MDSHESMTRNNRGEFWCGLYLAKFECLLTESGSYTAAEVQHHAQLLRSLFPLMGPPPSLDRSYRGPPTQAQCTHNNMPLEFSMNLTDRKSPIVRFILEPLGANVDSFSDLNRLYHQCFRMLLDHDPEGGIDVSWHCVLDELLSVHSQAEMEKVQASLPSQVPRLTRGYFGIDLGGRSNGTTTNVKPYWTPVAKAFVCLDAESGTDDADEFNVEPHDAFVARGRLVDAFAKAQSISLAAVRRLHDGLGPSLDALERYLEHGCRVPAPGLEFIFLGTDCQGGPDKRAKLYFRCVSNAFASVTDAVTLGGAFQDQQTDTLLRELEAVWHLFLDHDQPLNSVTTENARDNRTVEKPVLSPHHRMNGLCVGYEIRVGRVRPDVKIYIPLWQFHRNDASIVRLVEFISDARGWGLGGGKYTGMIQRVL
jgi:DMATS type aromatic prenyltransferase